MKFTFIFGLGRAQTALYGPRPTQTARARQTARRAVPCRASGPHGAVRAGRCSSPGPPPAQTATCGPDCTQRGPVPGFRTARHRARRQVFGARAPPRPNGTVRAGPHAARFRARFPNRTAPCAPGRRWQVFGARAAPRPNGTVPRAGPHAERSRARIPELTVPCAPVGVRRPGRAPPKRHRARRTACCKVLCPAPGPHGAVRAGRSSAPGLAPPKQHCARRTACCAVLSPAPGAHGALRAGRCTAPGPRPAQTAPCAQDRTLCGPVPGSRSARHRARRQVFSARAAPRPNGTVRAGLHAARSRLVPARRTP